MAVPRRLARSAVAAATAAAAAIVAVSAAVAGHAAAQSTTAAESATRYFTELRLTQLNATACKATPPPTPFDPAAIGSYSGAFECYRPRYPLRIVVRPKALVMTAEDDGGIVNKCAGDVIALRFGKAWERPYFNRKLGVDLQAAFGSFNPPDRFGGSCDAVRAELGVSDVRYGPWGNGRQDFIADLCLMVRLMRQLRDFRCDDQFPSAPAGTAPVSSPLASVVFFLESIAYQYNIPV